MVFVTGCEAPTSMLPGHVDGGFHAVSSQLFNGLPPSPPQNLSNAESRAYIKLIAMVAE
jgi:hypothetical protein